MPSRFSPRATAFLLFVEELTNAALEVARGSDPNIQIPPTLRDSLSERLDRLGPAKEVAQVASAFGREFSAALVAATLGRSEDELEGALDQLRVIDVIYQSSRVARRYTFKHALLQEAAYESMLRGRRREVHSRIAETLMRVRPATAETEPEVLATHLARGGDALGAADFWRRAGRLAQKNSAYREAIIAFKSALSLMSEGEWKAFVEVNRAVASAFFAIGEYESTRKHLADSAAAAEVGDDQVLLAEIAMQQNHVLNMYGGDLGDAVRFGRRALEIATRLDDEALAYGARFALGQTGWIGGDYAPRSNSTPQTSRRTCATCRACGILEQRDPCWWTRCPYSDQPSPIAASSSRGWQFSSVRGPFPGKMLSTSPSSDIISVERTCTGATLSWHCRYRARPSSMRLRRDLKFSLPWHQALLGYAEALLGEVESGVDRLNGAREASVFMHIPYIVACSSVLLAETLASRQPEQALDVAESALGIARANGFRAQEAELLRVKAAALVGVDLDAGEAIAKEGLTMARMVGLGPEEGHGLRTLGDICAAKRDAKSANEFYDLARSKYQSLGMTHWLKALA